MEGRSTRTEADRVFRSHIGGEGFFKLTHLGSGSQPIGAQDINNCLNVVLVNRLMTVRQQRGANRCATVNREHSTGCRTGAHVPYAGTCADLAMGVASNSCNWSPVSHWWLESLV